MDQQNIGLCFRHPRFVDHTECYDLLGGPHVRFALEALKESGVCDTLFFYSASDAENEAAKSLGYKIIPYLTGEEGKLRDKVREQVYNYIASYYDVPENGLDPMLRMNELIKTYVYVDANMALLTPNSFRELFKQAQSKCNVFAAAELKQKVMLPQKSGSIVPLVFNGSQVFYQEQCRPKVGQFYYETRAYTPSIREQGQANDYYYMIPQLEQLYIDDEQTLFVVRAVMQSIAEEGAWS